MTARPLPAAVMVRLSSAWFLLHLPKVAALKTVR
jgi:hypothetical protein